MCCWQNIVNFQGYHMIFLLLKNIKYFMYHLKKIILITVKGTSLFLFQIRRHTITLPFYYKCNFFLLNIYLFSDYFYFFFNSFRKGILSLSFINYLHFTILYTCKHVINQARHTSQLVAVYIKMKWFLPLKSGRKNPNILISI